jgi:hypothetical protein
MEPYHIAPNPKGQLVSDKKALMRKTDLAA